MGGKGQSVLEKPEDTVCGVKTETPGPNINLDRER